MLDGAFDEKQGLCERRFPQLSALRRRTKDLYRSISSTVASLIAGCGILWSCVTLIFCALSTDMLFTGFVMLFRVRPLKDAVAEPRVMEMGGRFLLPIKPTYKRGIGIVHDASRTGRTIYVEPAVSKTIAICVLLLLGAPIVLDCLGVLVSGGR